MIDIGTILQEKTGQLEAWCVQQSNKSNDQFALSLLQPLMAGRPMAPITNSALRPYCLAHILNDVAVNRRRSIVEFGAGISTLFIARLAQTNKLDLRIVSVEHDAGWQEAVRSMLAVEGLEGYVEQVHAPLVVGEHSLDETPWYDMQALASKVPSEGVDLVLVDGPPAYQQGKSKARYPALPYMYNRLGPKAAVYLDDFDRAGERGIIESWQADFPIKFENIAGSLAYATIGESFNVRPSSYA